MKLKINFFDGTVSKKTVGRKLFIITIIILLYKYVSVEPIIEVFGHFHKDAIIRFREVIFNGFFQKDAYGIIFALIWAFEQNFGHSYIENLTEILIKHQSSICSVELVSNQESQLYQNELYNLLHHKPNKRDLEWYKDQIKIDFDFFRLERHKIEVEYPNCFHVIEKAKKINNHFNFQS